MSSDQITENVEFLEEGTNVQSYVSTTTPSVDADLFGALKLTALATPITAVTVTGTPRDLQQLNVRISDNGSAQGITWGSEFEAVGVALPTTTVPGTRYTVRFLYDATSGKWGSVSAVHSLQTAPGLTSMTPHTALADVGGTAVTFVGTHLATATGATIGGLAVTSFVVTSDTGATGVTPAHATGSYDVVITTPSGSATLAAYAVYA